MKEQLYALFPPASEVLKTRHKEDTDVYTKECPYRYEKTRFCDRSASKVKPENEDEVQTESSPVTTLHGTKTGLSRPMTSMYPHPPSATPVVRSRSAVAESRDRWSPSWTGGSSHALAEWRGRLAETSTTPSFVQPNQPPPPTPVEAARQAGRPRVQSAFVRGRPAAVPAVPAVKRTIQSALPLTGVAHSDQPSDTEIPKSLQPTVRPHAPTPHRWVDEKELAVEEDEKEKEREALSTDYDQQLKTYGWKMEIPGDPFRIKRSCIGKRLPTTVVVSLHPSDRKSNSYQPQSSETFFYNTIPRYPMSFTIHPDWASEVYQARRMDLRSREGRAEDGVLAPRRRTRAERQPFVRYADFSFVY